MKNKLAMKLENCIKMAFSINTSFMKNNLIMQQRFLHNGPDTIDELLERHVVKKEKSYNSDEEEIFKHQRLTSTRREALSLYRDILRATRFFIWPDTRGVLWRDILRENARREFEEARLEKDPEVITRLLIGGRDSVQAALDKLVEKQKQELAKDQATRNGQ
ncbi:Complex 1 lyr protein [Thalictrum thalictroides]|uniref:Complex 1 lyr protein n=1 Tax=Thalictrum thalictroides TaxID=46969 RepID=A0A7J6VYR9_THATH|nr:Complex 1 lyr protein [Thalictrum thalictroides]